MRKEYTVESLRRALDHHRIEYVHLSMSRPTPWLIETGIGRKAMSDRECYAFVIGLAEMRRKFETAYPPTLLADISGQG